MTVGDAKIEYNKLLGRYKKAIEFFNNESVSQESKEKFLPDFQKVLEGLNYLLNKIFVYSKEEVLEGFK